MIWSFPGSVTALLQLFELLVIGVYVVGACLGAVVLVRRAISSLVERRATQLLAEARQPRDPVPAPGPLACGVASTALASVLKQVWTQAERLEEAMREHVGADAHAQTSRRSVPRHARTYLIEVRALQTALEHLNRMHDEDRLTATDLVVYQQWLDALQERFFAHLVEEADRSIRAQDLLAEIRQGLAQLEREPTAWTSPSCHQIKGAAYLLEALSLADALPTQRVCREGQQLLRRIATVVLPELEQ